MYSPGVVAAAAVVAVAAAEACVAVEVECRAAAEACPGRAAVAPLPSASRAGQLRDRATWETVPRKCRVTGRRPAHGQAPAGARTLARGRAPVLESIGPANCLPAVC